MKLSIVTTLYHSAAYIHEFCKRSTAVAVEYAGDDYEIIMVDDGSPDNSLEVAIDLAKTDKHIQVVELSRNFGHHKAIMTGLGYAQGDEIFLIDVDLEESPEWLIPFAEEKKKQNVDVVYGVQKKRKGGWFERFSGAMFYKTFNLLCDMKHPVSPTTARIMTKQYVEALLRHKEHALAFFCLCLITGFKQAEYTVVKHSTSPTTYSFAKKITLAINSITSFSDVFLKIIFWIGLGVSVFSLVQIGMVLFEKIFQGVDVEGWASLMVSIWFLSGVILMSLGVIGLYLSRIFMETKARPYSIVRGVHKFNE